MSKPTEKIVFEQRSKCPYCSKPIHTRVVRVTVKEAVKGVTKIEGFLEKDSQTTFEQDVKYFERGEKKKVKRKAF